MTLNDVYPKLDKFDLIFELIFYAKLIKQVKIDTNLIPQYMQV